MRGTVEGLTTGFKLLFMLLQSIRIFILKGQKMASLYQNQTSKWKRKKATEQMRAKSYYTPDLYDRVTDFTITKETL